MRKNELGERNMIECFNIRYVKLQFKVRFLEDCKLYMHKASAIRGGIGEMLLRANCVRKRDCEKCDFSRECIVQKIMYSQFENRPEFMSNGDSVGYVVECENYQEEFYIGDELVFRLLLFGNNIVYFNQYMQALYALGQNGLGKDMAKFEIVEVKNSRGKSILKDNHIYMQFYEIENLKEYIKSRREQIQKRGMQGKICFRTPLTQKYQGNFLKEFEMPAIVKSIQRRVYILNSYEGHDVEEWYKREYPSPNIYSQTQKSISVRRYSNRKDTAMYLKGIVGQIQLAEIPEEVLDLLLAGELLHIGKNTSFGFGKYVLM